MSNTLLLKAGVIGWPVAHSLSPRLHRFWLEKYGIQGSYEAFAIEPRALANTLHNMGSQGLKGVNLTVPHKETAYALVDYLTDTAQQIGAINLITLDEKGSLLGHNTDAYGFAQNLLSAGFTRKTSCAFVLGAGGAARAVISALANMGFDTILIANRTAEKAQKLAHVFSSAACKISVVPWEQAHDALEGVTLLVNTTSLGMKGEAPLTLSLDRLPLSATVTDIVYAPLETQLLTQAFKRGHAIVDGLGMLLHQARPSFAAFFGRDPKVSEELRQFVLAGKKSA